jgi:pilus assembly protein CpaE
VSIHVSTVGSTTNELTDIFRDLGFHSTALSVAELSKLVQPGVKPPRVIVLDMRQLSALPPVVAAIKKEHPETGFVMVAAKLDPAVMLDAMRAGVNECVTEPLKASEIGAAIQRVVGTVAGATAGQLFAVTGAKGGVGATTVAVNIATSLSLIAKGRTLLIDAHPAGGDAALFLGVEPSFSLQDAIENIHRLDEAFLNGLVAKTATGPDLLASADRTTAAAIDPRKLRAVIEFALQCYRYVVVDAPRADSSIGDMLDLTTSIVVVTTQELASIRSGSRALAALRQRYGSERVQIVLNRYDRSAEIGSEDLERAVGSRIGHTFPSNYRLAIDALNKGRPLVVDNHNKLAASLSAYARTLSGVRVERTATDRSSASFLSKLTGRK